MLVQEFFTQMIEKKIISSIKKFHLSLKNKIVLTEGATGNYRVTPVIAALAGAKVYAVAKDSGYGSSKEAMRQIYCLAGKMNVRAKITIVENINGIDLSKVDVLTNTGFLRPISSSLVNRLASKCVIPLMWEPWEYRESDLDLWACHGRGIKVYGTNESDKRLRIREYIGLTVLSLLLNNHLSPFSAKILLVGCKRFVGPVENILKINNYSVLTITNYNHFVSMDDIDAIVVLEHERNIPVIGGNEAFINKKNINRDTLVIHICGNVLLKHADFNYIPKNPRRFGYMSYTADFIDDKAVIDLHTAGLRVAEGMLKANKLGLNGLKYKIFMEKNYSALSFDNSKLW